MATYMYENNASGANRELQLVSFRLGDEEYGVDILKVQEINRMLAINKMPNTPAYVDGIINLRGKVIPIVNLRTRFGLPRQDVNKQTRIVVVDIRGKILGFVVDSVSEVLRLDVDTIEPSPEMATIPRQEFIDGVGKVNGKLLILLNIDKLFSDVDADVMSAVQEGMV